MTDLQKIGGAESVLQSTLRTGNPCLGAEMLRREPETGHPGGYAHPGTDGYILLPRLYLQQGKGDSIYQGTVALQREQECSSFPFDDYCFLI